MAVLPGATRAAVEELSQRYEYKSDFARRYVSEGKAETLLDVLDARGLAVSEEQRKRILSCRDFEQLKLWTRRAVSVSSAEELFAE